LKEVMLVNFLSTLKMQERVVINFSMHIHMIKKKD